MLIAYKKVSLLYFLADVYHAINREKKLLRP